MNDEQSFRDGYTAGWNAWMGGGCQPPPLARCHATDGRTPFEQGIREAIERALGSPFQRGVARGSNHPMGQ